MRDRSRAGLLLACLFGILVFVVTYSPGFGASIADVILYQRYADAILDGAVPYRDAVVRIEYPPGSLLAFLPPALLSSGGSSYLALFCAEMALLGAFAMILIGKVLTAIGRSDEIGRRLAPVALSPLALDGVIGARFDALPALLVVAALLSLVRGRERAGFLLIGLGIAVKLYPAVILPVAAARAWRLHGRGVALRRTAEALAVPIVAYGVFALVSAEGVGNSLWRQLGRPLQIESLGAGVLLAWHHLGSLELGVVYTNGSHNLVSGAADVVGSLTTVVQVAALLAVYVLFARGEPSVERLLRYSAAAVVAFVAFGKVLSPQFLIWIVLLVPLAVCVPWRRVALAGGAACVLTALWFPDRYFDLVPELAAYPSFLVLARGLALVALLAVVTGTGFGAPRSRALDR